MRLNPKSLKIEKKNHKIVISGWKHIYFSFIGYTGHSYWVRNGNQFCKAFQNYFRPSFVIVHSAVRMHELLLAERKQCQLGQKHFWHVLHCRAAIHGQIWMNNVPNERRIMLSCTEMSFVISCFNFEKFFEWN